MSGRAQESFQRSLAGQDRIYAARLEECRLRIKQAEDADITRIGCKLLGEVYGNVLAREGYNVIHSPDMGLMFRDPVYPTEKENQVYREPVMTIVSWGVIPECRATPRAPVKEVCTSRARLPRKSEKCALENANDD